MVEADREAGAILVMVVDGSAPRGQRSVAATASHAQQIRLAQALLFRPAGREIDEPAGDACRIYDRWSEAVDAALGLVSLLPRLPAELADIDVRIGLDLVGDSGEHVAALRAAAIASSATRDEIRLGEALARLVERDLPDRLVVRRVVDAPSGGQGIHRLARARDEVPGNLADATTSFIGRAAEVRTIAGLVEQRQLVTITGPPGTGKSRLATEVASRVLGRFTDGAWFVPLAAITDPELVISAIATALGVPVPPGVPPAAAVSAQVTNRRLLIVLDNFEHVLPGGAQVADLLAAAPGLHVLVTSQAPTGIPGEVEFILAPFPVPSESSGARSTDRGDTSAVDLFVERATSTQSPAPIGPDDRALVAEICRRLDGLPLAIELAAARVRLLPLSSILERLDARLGVLDDLPESSARHRSLRAAVAWSYDLLDPPTRRLFRQLSVFRGGWTIEAAVRVGGGDGATDEGVLASLASLQHASLLVQTESGSASPPRLTMLETLRQFAAERLDEAGQTEAVRRLHADDCRELAAQLGPRLTGPDQASALDRLALEHDNIRAALAWLLDADPVGALRIGSTIWRFWQMRGHLAEGSRWVGDAMAAAGDRASADDLASGRAAAGGLAYWRGDLDETERHYAEAVDLRRALGDDVQLADALFDLAFVFDPALRPPPEDADRTAAGIRIAEEAHARFVTSQHEPGIAKAEWLLGSILPSRDIERSMALLASSVDRFRLLGDRFGLGWALHSYGLTLLRSTDPDSDSAAAAFGEALGLFAAAGDSSATGLLLADFAEVAKADGDALRAARLQGAAAGTRASTQAELAVANAPWLEGDAVPRGLIDPAALEQAWADGHALSQPEAIAYALRSPAALLPDSGLRVSALGPLIVERSGRSVSDWGGPKAGSRHALAIFAFLMDRGDRGVTKDEVIEVLWPDAEVEPADLNFHRTLGGLRSRLAQGSDGGSGGEIVFANGRYRLAGAVISWLDVAEFQQRLLNAAEASDQTAAIRGLEAARLLYRGDYLDDCPLYGDSAYVEERRRFLRNRLVDALVDLGGRYALRRDNSLASARFREALNLAGGDCPSASEGLRQLGVVAT